LSKKWYPVIDYTICKECGACVKKCKHGVFNIKKAPSPVVMNGVITYVGDNTNWTPPKGQRMEEESCCCKLHDKKVIIEYLYLDLKVCDRCIGTDNILEDVLQIIGPTLKAAGYDLEFNKIEIDTIDKANKYEFISSPTIRVNGQDIFKVEENNCDCCSDISSAKVNCRVYKYKDKLYEIPPKEMLTRSILKSIFSTPQVTTNVEQYVLPINLKNFFDGKHNKIDCSCGGNCC